MNWLTLESRNLHRVAYDRRSRELHVIFKAAVHLVYTYTNVGPRLFARLVSARSIGRFFSRKIRLNPKHPYTRRPW